MKNLYFMDEGFCNSSFLSMKIIESLQKYLQILYSLKKFYKFTVSKSKAKEKVFCNYLQLTLKNNLQKNSLNSFPLKTEIVLYFLKHKNLISLLF